jgi:Divergent InlB B-repeat domain
MALTLLAQLLLLAIYCVAAQGASFSSIRSGPWSDPGTWGVHAIPGNGDTVTIRHIVTVHSNTTVGTSPYETKPTSTPAIEVQDTSTPGYDGHIIVQNGGALNVRGNVKMTSTGTNHQAKLTVEPGGTFVFDNSQAPSARYRIYPNANGAHARISFGSPHATARAVFRGKPEGADGMNSSFIHSGPEMYSWAVTSIYGTDIYDCGTSSEPCIRTYEYNSNSAPVIMWDTDFVRTGGIELKTAGTNTAAKSQTWILRRVRTFDTLNTARSIHFSTPPAVAAGGTREVTSCFFDRGINQATLGQFEITNTVFAGNFYSHGIDIVPSPFYWNKFENNLVHNTKAHASGSTTWGNIKDAFFIQESGASNTNPHGFWPHISLRRDITIDGVIGQYTHVAGIVNEAGTGAAEGEFLGAGACSFADEFTHTIKNSIVLPNSSGLTLGHRNSPSYLFVGLNMGNGVQTPQCRIDLIHNTIMGGFSEAGSGIMFGEGTTDPPPYTFDSIKSNLYWDVTPRSTLVHHLGGPDGAGQRRVDIATPSGISHNANYNYVPASGFNAPNDKCNGTPYRMACSEVPGWNDLNDEDPRFIDTTRNFEKWGQVLHGADGTVAGSLAVFAATPANELSARITELLTFVREGFMPQNEAYRTAAHDGTTIGAVQMTMPSSVDTTSATVHIESNVAAAFVLSGSKCPVGTYMTPATVTLSYGAVCLIAPVVPAEGLDTRWTFAGWADGWAESARNITAIPNAVYTMTFRPEYKIKRSVSGHGTVSGSDAFYAAGSSVQLIASPQEGSQFSGWSGSAAGSTNPLTIVMDGPKSITANFSIATTAVRIEANPGIQVQVSGTGCPVGIYTAPAILFWNTGSTCAVTIVRAQ